MPDLYAIKTDDSVLCIICDEKFHPDSVCEFCGHCVDCCDCSDFLRGAQL